MSNATSQEMTNLEPWLISAIIVDGLVISMNIIQLGLLLRNWRILDRTEHLLLSLCISDLISGIVLFGLDTHSLKYFIVHGEINLTRTESFVLECFIIFFILSSNFHIISLAIERLVAVSFPMNYAIFTTLRCKTFTICLVWTLGVLISPAVILFNKLYYDKKTENKQGKLIMGGVLLTACVTVFSSYMILVVALIRREQQMKEIIPEELHRQLRDRKTTMICLLFGFSFVVCVLPHTLGFFSENIYHNSSSFLLTSNHFINPLIYFAKAYVQRRRTMSSNSQNRLIPRDRTFLTEVNGSDS